MGFPDPLHLVSEPLLWGLTAEIKGVGANQPGSTSSQSVDVAALKLRLHQHKELVASQLGELQTTLNAFRSEMRAEFRALRESFSARSRQPPQPPPHTSTESSAAAVETTVSTPLKLGSTPPVGCSTALVGFQDSSVPTQAMVSSPSGSQGGNSPPFLSAPPRPPDPAEPFCYQRQQPHPLPPSKPPDPQPQLQVAGYSNLYHYQTPPPPTLWGPPARFNRSPAPRCYYYQTSSPPSPAQQVLNPQNIPQHPQHFASHPNHQLSQHNSHNPESHLADTPNPSQPLPISDVLEPPTVPLSGDVVAEVGLASTIPKSDDDVVDGGSATAVAVSSAPELDRDPGRAVAKVAKKMKQGRVVFGESLKLGHVTLTQKFGNNIQKIREHIRLVVKESGLVRKIKDCGGEGEKKRREKFFGRRSEFIVAGAVLLEEIFEVLGIEEMEVSGYALAEGVIAESLAKVNGGYDLKASARWSSVVRLAMMYNGKKRMKIKKGYHNHSYCIIMNGEHLHGYNSEEVKLIALLARHHRKQLPSFDHDGMLGLNHFRLVKRLGRGDIGSVYLSELSGTRTCFAMKVVDKAPLDLIHDSCQLLIASGTPQPVASVPQPGSFDMVHKRTTSCLLVIALSLLEVLLSEIFRLETAVTNQAPIVHWVPCCLLLCTCKLEVHTVAGFLNTWFISHLFCLPLEHRFEKGRKCHGLVVKIGLEENVHVGNALPCMYAKCGVMRDAMQVFGEMAEPNEVTFTAMMGGLKQTDRVVEALEMFRLMCRKGMRVGSVSLSSMLGVCAKWCGESSVCDHGDGVPSNVNGQQIHGLTVKLGFEGDLHLSNSLLDMYAKSTDVKSAEKVFPTIPEASVVSWNVIITGYGLRFQRQKSIEYLRRMQFCDFEPDDVTYINLLAACVKSGDIKSGCHMSDNISRPNVISGNAILSGYFQIDDHMEVIKLFREMQFQGVKSDRSTLAIALSSSAAMGILEAGKEIHTASCKIASNTDMYWRSLLRMSGFANGCLDSSFSRMVLLLSHSIAASMGIYLLMQSAWNGVIGATLVMFLTFELMDKLQWMKVSDSEKLEDKFC